MQALTVRDVGPDEFERLGEIDRSERIVEQYVAEGGSLRLVAVDITVKGWYPTEVEGYVARLHALHAAGGSVVGAFDGTVLTGLASLDVRPIGSLPGVLQLEFLHVSAPYRHKGVGGRLVSVIAERAFRLGAQALYISATPTRNTVDAYMHMGAQVLGTPDPALLALEPEDIHLLLPIASNPP